VGETFVDPYPPRSYICGARDTINYSAGRPWRTRNSVYRNELQIRRTLAACPSDERWLPKVGVTGTVVARRLVSFPESLPCPGLEPMHTPIAP
jgi:hypothetical protein